mgnify:CR=1 FL=1
MRNLKSVLLIAIAAMLSIAEACAADVLLSGVVSARNGRKLEGVTVSAKAEGSTITTSVYTDQDGNYYFPPMAAGKYNVWAQALGFERSDAQVDLSANKRQNIALNDLGSRVQLVECDLTKAASRRAAGLRDSLADALVTNPPWHDRSEAQISPDQRRAAAHAYDDSRGLEPWVRAMAALLRPGGRFALIHRADTLKKCLDVLEGRPEDLLDPDEPLPLVRLRHLEDPRLGDVEDLVHLALALLVDVPDDLG